MKRSIDSKIINFVFLSAIALMLIFFNNLGYFEQPKNVMAYIMAPLLKLSQKPVNQINDLLYILEEIDKFKQDNARLRKENLKLNYSVSKLKEVERENDVLRKQIGFSEKMCEDGQCINWIMGSVVGKNPTNYGKYIIVDLGRKQGVKNGQVATVSPGIVVGKVVETFDELSKIMLITSFESSINSIAQTTRAGGIVRGKYSTGIKFEMVNQSDELIEGDLIITSGLEENIPKGLIIGKISTVEESPNRVFKQADVVPFADFNHIEEIFIAEQK